MPSPAKETPSSRDGGVAIKPADDGFGRAVQAIETAAVFIDAEERILCANAKFLEEFERRDVVGLNLDDALPRHSAGTSHPWPGAGLDGTGWAHRKIRTADGRWFLQRTIPFSSDGLGASGAVVTFTRVESSTILDDRVKLLGASTQVVWWWDWDFDTGTISFEVDQPNLLGFEVSALPHTGPEFLGLMHPDDLGRVHLEIESCMAGRVHQWTGEHRIRMPNGSWRWALSSGRLAEPDALGRATRMVGITIDINDRRRVADQMRRDSEILSQLREAVVCLDVQGRVLYWNEPATRKFGWQAEEVLGTVFVEHMSDAANRQDVERLLTRALAGEVVSGERQTLRKDGSRIWIEFSWSVFRDSVGATAGVIGVARDITYRKEAQLRLERNAAMLRDLNEIVVSCGPDYRIEFVNDAFERVLGWSKAVALKQPYAFWLPPAAQAEALGHQQRVLQGGALVAECHEYRRDGSRIWIEWRSHRVVDANGATTGIISVGMDIEARKRAEFEREELRRRMADAQRLETLGALAGGVAHEFNNILSVISGLTELALAKASDERKSVEYHRRVKSAVDHGRDIVNRILSFSRYRDPLRTAIAVDELVRECERMVQAVAPSTIRISTHVEKPCGPVFGDAHQLVQVVLNFVANSIHAIGARPGRIAITARNRVLDGTELKSPSGMLKGHYVAMEVEDDGCGMDAETQARIFDPFYTTKPRGEGTGLGLSVAKAIIQGHGGAIDVRSQVGGGTQIAVYIPAVRDAAPALG